MEHMGFTFSRDNRIFIISAQAYLMLAGIGLIINGTLLSDSSSRPAFLHLFTLGFLLFLIYGLGAHMIPRFAGNPLPEDWKVWVQMGLAHSGVVAYASGYFFNFPLVTLSGAILAWTALFIFTWRMWQVLWLHN